MRRRTNVQIKDSITLSFNIFCETFVNLNADLSTLYYHVPNRYVKYTIQTPFIRHKNLMSHGGKEHFLWRSQSKARRLYITARRMVNLTEGGYLTVMKTLLSANIRVDKNIAIAAVNIVLSITASLGNILILIALRKVTSIHPPTKLLFQCLAITDLGVGLISQPLMATLMLLVDNIDIKIWKVLFFYLSWPLSIAFCGVSVFTSTALSVDRLLALFLGLRYRHVVTLKRIRAVLACGCLALLSIMSVWYFHAKTARITMPIFWTLCLIISLFSYTKIVLRLRQHQFSVRDNAQQGQANTGAISLNLERYKKTVVSVALVQLALFICYFPSSTVFILIHLKGIHPSIDFILLGYCVILVFLNSSLNPFLYCWRIKEIRQAVKTTIRRFCTCLSQGTSTVSTNQ